MTGEKYGPLSAPYNWPITVAIIGAACAALLPYIFGREPIKEVSYYEVREVFSKFPTHGNNRLEINGVVVPVLVAHKVKLWNSGNEPLEGVSVIAKFHSQDTAFKILSVAHRTSPEVGFGKIEEKVITAYERHFKFKLLNPKDQDNITLLTNLITELEIAARAKGLVPKEIDKTGLKGILFIISLPLSGILIYIVSRIIKKVR